MQASLSRHGLGHSVQLVPGTRTLELVRPDTCPEPPPWTILEEAGVTSLVVDVPFLKAGNAEGVAMAARTLPRAPQFSAPRTLRTRSPCR
jgi:hypothetical protein